MTPFRSEKNTNWEGAFRDPADGPLARQDRGRLGLQRDRPAPRLAADVPRRRRRARHRREAARRATPPATRPSRCTSTATTCCRTSPARPTRARARGSSTSPTTATCSRSASTTGRSCSWSSGCRGRCRSGRSRSSPLRVPKLFNLRTDPFERADMTSNTYYDWFIDQRVHRVRGDDCGGRSSSQTFQEFPPRQQRGELHHRPGGGEARGGSHDGAMTLASWNDTATRDGDRRLCRG